MELRSQMVLTSEITIQNKAIYIYMYFNVEINQEQNTSIKF